MQKLIINENKPKRTKKRVFKFLDKFPHLLRFYASISVHSVSIMAGIVCKLLFLWKRGVIEGVIAFNFRLRRLAYHAISRYGNIPGLDWANNTDKKLEHPFFPVKKPNIYYVRLFKHVPSD